MGVASGPEVLRKRSAMMGEMLLKAFDSGTKIPEAKRLFSDRSVSIVVQAK
jgi:hypothetical protein